MDQLDFFRFSRGTPWHLPGFLIALAIFLAPLATHATTVEPPTFEALVNESDYIVRGVVKSVRSEWRVKQGHRNIFTLVEVEVLEVISGTPPQPLVLEMLGGQVGDEAMVVHGMPKFAVGQEDILFVRGNGRQFYPLTAAMHGRYPIQRDRGTRAQVARSNHVPLRNTAEVALPMNEGHVPEQKETAGASVPALTPEDFAQQIRATINVNYRRAPRGN